MEPSCVTGQEVRCKLRWWCFKKAAGLLQMGEQGIHFSSEGLIAGARVFEESGAAFSRQPHRGFNQFVDLLPDVTLHSLFAVSSESGVHDAARLWRCSSLA